MNTTNLIGEKGRVITSHHLQGSVSVISYHLKGGLIISHSRSTQTRSRC